MGDTLHVSYTRAFDPPSFEPVLMSEPILTSRVLPDDLHDRWRQMHQAKRDRGLLDRFNDRKLGMFIHWGLYSIPAGVWKGCAVPGISEWIMWMADIPRDEYAELARQFNPDKFDAAEWVGLARRTGMQYIVVTAKHHDGFALWDSQHSDFNIAAASPTDLQPLDQLHAECRRQGVGFGLYYSHVIDWRDGWEGEGGTVDASPVKRDTIKDNPMNTWDPADVSRRHYFRTKAYPQLQELLDRYPDLHCIWFDYWYEGKYLNPPEAFAFYKMVYDAQPDCLVNSRVDGYEDESRTLGDYVTAGDNALLAPGKKVYWETPGTLNNTWGYCERDHDWKTESELLFWIVSIISRGGNYLLNIGPRADGSIPDGTYAGFDHIARWLAVNREAVFGSTAWKIDREGQTFPEFTGTTSRQETGFQLKFTAEDFWFTRKGDATYAIALATPTEGNVLIKSMAGESVSRVTLLGSDQPANWSVTDAGLVVTLPPIDHDSVGFTLKINQ